MLRHKHAKLGLNHLQRVLPTRPVFYPPFVVVQEVRGGAFAALGCGSLPHGLPPSALLLQPALHRSRSAERRSGCCAARVRSAADRRAHGCPFPTRRSAARPATTHKMAAAIAASSFAGLAVQAAPRSAARTARRCSVVPRAMLETQRMATSFDGFK